MPPRLKEMKQMQRDPMATSKARKAERKADEKSGLITIKPMKLDGAAAVAGGGFKKGGFKSAFRGTQPDAPGAAKPSGFKKVSSGDNDAMVLDPAAESDTEDEGYEMYDPRKPTG
ncbi:MAG: hypothetical protein M1814_003580 [Vezdaea aestivalis]|nr:MAG: hypothetical protein M1814_003580 [Vezdaea aestivalis]